MWVIALVVGLVALAIFILCVPLDAVLSIDTTRTPKFSLRLVWLFGLIGKDISLKKKEPKEKKEAPEAKPKKKKKRRWVDFRTAVKILRTRGLLRKVIGLVKGILGQFRIRELMADLRVGLGDPADTGFLFAVISPMIPLLNLPSRCRVEVQPSFRDEPAFEGYLRGAVRLQPVRLLQPLLEFLFSLTIFRVIKTLVLSRWKRKK